MIQEPIKDQCSLIKIPPHKKKSKETFFELPSKKHYDVIFFLLWIHGMNMRQFSEILLFQFLVIDLRRGKGKLILNEEFY